jgi:hypothetical protein
MPTTTPAQAENQPTPIPSTSVEANVVVTPSGEPATLPSRSKQIAQRVTGRAQELTATARAAATARAEKLRKASDQLTLRARTVGVRNAVRALDALHLQLERAARGVEQASKKLQDRQPSA